MKGNSENTVQQTDSALFWELEQLPKVLPAIDNTERANFDKLFAVMGITQHNKLGLGQKADHDADKVGEHFVLNTLNEYFLRIQKFSTAIKRFISAMPTSYQNKIGKASNIQLRVLNAANSWKVVALSDELNNLQMNAKNMTVEKMIPAVYMIYRPLLQMLFLGENDFNSIIEKTFSEIHDKTTVNLTQLHGVIEEAKIEWSFIIRSISRGLYPIVMRICSSYCVDMQEFLDTNIQRIMTFLNLTKEDIILPGEFEPVDLNALEAESEKKVSAYAATVNQSNMTINNGLMLLDAMFPEAGWLSLNEKPDMYPYFQPLFSFAEGFNVLSPANPLQVAVVLMRIIEDLLSGCSSIDFLETNSSSSALMKTEEIEKAISNWYLSRMNVFDKRYAAPLLDYVNRVYSHQDYKTSSYAIKTLSSIIWLQKSEFFPHLKFDLSYVAAETSQGSLPVFKKVARLAYYFDWLLDNINESIKSNNGNRGGAVVGIENPWDRFVFTIDNTSSNRLTTVLEATSPLGTTNASLIKSIAEIFAVLDWWLNRTNSFAYETVLHLPYRSDDTTGEPIFSVPVRKDVFTLLSKTKTRR
ncbi:MAG: hypothetical protein GX297_01970 [Treponema sp.]|jgi:hypothetical protein|nr:hypothetical protein [Treponema sp.]